MERAHRDYDLARLARALRACRATHAMIVICWSIYQKSGIDRALAAAQAWRPE